MISSEGEKMDVDDESYNINSVDVTVNNTSPTAITELCNHTGAQMTAQSNTSSSSSNKRKSPDLSLGCEAEHHGCRH